MKNNSMYKSVNWHILKNCNYNCVFCFSAFKDVERILNKQDSFSVLEKLKEVGVEKITFTGGEPLLHPFLGSLLKKAKKLEMTTMIVTTCSMISKDFLREHHHLINWIGLSIESNKEEIEQKLGRGNGNHIKMIKKVVKEIRAYDIKLS